MSKKHVLEADSIIKTIGERKILSDIFLRCSTGEVVGILGRNGCGKSTLLKIIFGTAPTEDKSIRIDGTVYQRPYKKGNLIAYLPQHNFLPANIGVRKMIEIYADAQYKSRMLMDERIMQHANSKIRHLSGGELRYLETLLLLNTDAPFILLNEPFSGIEPLYQDRILALIKEYKTEKGIIITDHLYNTVIAASDRIVLLSDGKTRPVTELADLEDYGYVPPHTFSRKEAAGDMAGAVADKDRDPGFYIDRQTFKDIHVFDEGRRAAVFHFFNYTQTVGGADKLETLFKMPVADIRVLEDRRDTIAFFCETGMGLKIGRQQLDDIEYYLRKDLPVLKRNVLDAGLYVLRNKWKQTSGYYTIRRGISGLISLLAHLYEFADRAAQHRHPSRLDDIISRVYGIVLNSSITDIVLSADRGNIAAASLSKCDHYFRVEKKQQIRALLDLVYELDAYSAAAKAAEKHGFCFPAYSSSGDSKISLTGLFNPLLEQPVANDFEINQRNNLCFITGANMSGKSTFMKSFGMAVLLAHVGFPVPAKKMETTLFNGLVATINLSDNISLGYSHFFSEVKRIKEVALMIRENRKMIVIFDELFRGTNVKDAAEASQQIISAFSEIPQCLFLISSHIVEIADHLSAHKNIFFNCFESRLQDDAPVYEYKMSPGVSTERLGMSIIRTEKIVEILEAAKGASNAPY